MSDIELHLHLDGAITVPIARKLAGLGQVELPSEDDEELKKELQVPADCPDLTSFLKCFELPGSLMQTPETLSEAVRLVLDDCEEQGVVYAEIRFAPQFHQRLSMNQEDAVKAALEGLNEVNQRTEKRGTGIHANLILCCMRGEGNEEENRETLRLAEKYLVPDGGVVALDLAGAEALFPTSKYRDLFLEAKEKGIPFTIHAGEADGAGSVRDAVEFGASRIGHGVRSEEDPELVKLLAEKKIPLEMCPTSNRQTHAVEDMSSYPILRYLDAGIPVTLNTDDPAIEGTTLPEEYAYLKSLTGLTGEQEKTLRKNAIEAAFTTEKVKSGLRKLLVLVLLFAQLLLPNTAASVSAAKAALTLSKKNVSMTEGTYVVVDVKKNTYPRLDSTSSDTSVLTTEIVGDKLRLISFRAGKATVKVAGYNKNNKLKKTVTVSVTVTEKERVDFTEEYGPNSMHAGEATWYDPKDSPGMAGLGDYRNKYFVAAMNTDDYMNDLAGAFIELTGESGETINVLIVDMLVGAKKGNIDLSKEAFQEIAPLATGRVAITWRVVPLPTDDPVVFRWHCKSTKYWAALQVRNSVYPVKKVEYLDEKTGEYIPLRKESYYVFTADNGLGSDGPFTFRITDVFGHQIIEENIPYASDNVLVTGTKNFPALDNGEVG